MVILRRWLILTAVLHIPVLSLNAQWITQTLELKQGWNAVYLEINPYPSQCNLLLRDVPIKSVWMYDQRFAPVQYIQDPNELLPENPRWRSFFPESQPNSFASNLFGLEGGKTYLIETTQPAQLTLTGYPHFFSQKWQPDSYNLVGFPVDPQNPPTFTSWFSPSAAHKDFDIWSLGDDQKWSKVTNPSQSTVQSGKAYWVYCRGSSSYQGPVQIELPGGSEINFNRTLAEKMITIRHLGTGSRQVTLEVIPSAPIPPVVAGETGVDVIPLAGEASLFYYGKKVEGNVESSAILSLPASLIYPSGNNSLQAIRLVFDRTKLLPSQGPENARYQSVLVIKDGAGFRRWIGVIGQGMSSTMPIEGKTSTRQAGENSPYAGLWVGSVTVNKVSEPNDPQNRATPTDVDFDFRIILHVDNQGTVRLLSEVTQLWRDGTTKPDPNDPNLKVVDQPGRYILYTPNAPPSLQNEISLGTNVKPGSFRDDRPFAARISSALFSLLDQNGKPYEPVMETIGDFGSPDSNASVNLTLGNSDPTNPFHHQYHPQHRFPRSGETVTEQNDWTIQRSLTFTFTESPPDGRVVPGWGDIEVGGLYQEVVKGLSRNAVTVEGYFSLRRSSTVAVLNDGLVN